MNNLDIAIWGGLGSCESSPLKGRSGESTQRLTMAEIYSASKIVLLPITKISEQFPVYQASPRS